MRPQGSTAPLRRSAGKLAFELLKALFNREFIYFQGFSPCFYASPGSVRPRVHGHDEKPVLNQIQGQPRSTRWQWDLIILEPRVGVFELVDPGRGSALGCGEAGGCQAERAANQDRPSDPSPEPRQCSVTP